VESIEPIWLFGAIVLACGIFLGVLLLRLFNPKTGDVEKLQAELDQAHKDMESYKASVNSHFNKTSDLVNELTQDYVKVYRHLAEGAQTLSDTREFTQVLDQPQGQVLITVEAPVEPVPDPDPLVSEAEQAPDPDPLAAQAGQPPTPVDDDAISEGSDAAQTSVADDSPEPPADYARVDDSGTETAETVSADTESADNVSVAGTNKDADEDEDVAAVSADEVTPGENVTANATDAEQQAVADETETDSTRKT
jgi:uncharacterized membrane-anchored protein YhcB (DUF1043 family)